MAAFGSPVNPSSKTQTLWDTPEIWMRRQFIVPHAGNIRIQLRVRHSADARIYLNGALAATVTGESDGYVTLPISPAAVAALNPGLNLIAVHAQRVGTDSFIDVGVVVSQLEPAALLP